MPVGQHPGPDGIGRAGRFRDGRQRHAQGALHGDWFVFRLLFGGRRWGLGLAEAGQKGSHQIIGPQGLGQEVAVHLVDEALDLRGILVDPGHDDDGHLFSEGRLAHRPAEGEAVHGGHEEIGDDEIRALVDEDGQPLLSARGVHHAWFQPGQPFVGADQALHRFAGDGVVFDEEDLLGHYDARALRVARPLALRRRS